MNDLYDPGQPPVYLSTTSKRNRNPNWTDGEIIRFLEILSEEEILIDLKANRIKQVFSYVSQRLCSEGALKSVDQCQIKLKNLKAQYRYIKERIPQVGHLDLEDDEVLQRLVFECEARGISPYYTKHLRYLKRFLAGLTGSSKAGNKRRKPGPGGYSHTSRYLNPAAASSSSSSSTPAVAVAVAVTSSSSTPSSSSTSGYVSTGFSPGLGLASSAEPVGAAKLSLDSIRRAGSGIVKRPGASSLPPIRISEARVLEAAPGSRKRSRREDDVIAVSPPRSSTDILVEEEDEEEIDLSFKVPRLNADEVLSSEGGLAKDYMEKFNRSMMEQYLEHQRRVQQSFRRWELEKQRQHEQSMERWRTQAEEHTKQMFGMFVQVMDQCNNAMSQRLLTTDDEEEGEEEEEEDDREAKSTNGGDDGDDDYDPEMASKMEPDVTIGEEGEEEEDEEESADGGGGVVVVEMTPEEEEDDE